MRNADPIAKPTSQLAVNFAPLRISPILWLCASSVGVRRASSWLPRTSAARISDVPPKESDASMTTAANCTRLPYSGMPSARRPCFS
ncbi:hypothetical protein C4F17_01485 [Variovorax sp. PMC12]|nr:hypothetical protein C4F17_01485 [Variovorax sp. PMC12]